VEFDGLRIDMNSSRERFLEALSVVRKALSSKHLDLKAMSTQELFGVFVDSHVWGTPDSVREQLRERLRGVGAAQFVGVFKFGSMSVAEAESSIRLFGAKVLPALHDMETPQPIVPAANPV
jgi:hypothetical protein